jgi:hypothetical protein
MISPGVRTGITIFNIDSFLETHEAMHRSTYRRYALTVAMQPHCRPDITRAT